MKSVKSVFAIVLFLFVTASAQAQAAAESNYFAGKWNVLIKGTPDGDLTVPMRFELKDGKMKGYFKGKDEKEETEMSSVEAKDTEINMAFSAMGYDVTIKMAKTDDDHATGKVMDALECEATRVKE